ncbi:FMN-dependent alpha-hydroxy acid dehydrogenase [Caballeronia sordidicola]|uniref:FMN-dependent alpha-hydroxy acid dehydrogenase n=1 Tax=Caballeronia sordidicola TaxID=196367 RepID=A0A158HL74_CABSO|nr:FMN-dependent alpha-hydroxy acid dehydrogenase [Caballeronia sordidicola]
MLRTKRRTFGNIAGHVSGVNDLADLSAWTAQQLDPTLSWDSIRWLRDRWSGKLIIKGILDPEDAYIAAQVGVDAVIVSNHGGRQLDCAPSTISVVSEVARALGDRTEIFLDGGVRSGQDVLKALCVGADGVLIGRPFLYGLGAMGAQGVMRTLEILQKEMDLTLALCGRKSVADVGRDMLMPAPF